MALHGNFPAEKPHGCMYCPKRFTGLHLLKSHISTHKGDWPHLSHVCGKGFNEKAPLEERIQKEHIGWLYICPHCGQGFGERSKFEHHISTEHSTLHVCLGCDKRFNSRALLKSHRYICMRYKGVLNQEKQRNPQDIYTREPLQTFFSSPSLESQRRHTDYSTCTTCIRGFLNEKNLKTHLASHKLKKKL